MNKSNLNNKIINNQLIPNNITKDSTLNLFRYFDKTIFFKNKDISIASIDENYFYNENRFMLRSSTIAKLLDLVSDEIHDSVLNVGSGLGYSSALLSKISNKVFSIESSKSLHEQEKEIFKSLDINNIKSICEDFYTSQSLFMPFDLIFINGCLSSNADFFLGQLSLNGKMVCIEKNKNNVKKIVKYIKNKKIINRSEFYMVNSPILL